MSIVCAEIGRLPEALAEIGELYHNRPHSGCAQNDYHLWRSTLDRLCAWLLLFPAFPLIVLLIVLIRLTSRGPGLYRQWRVGKDGQVFAMLKLRTMTCDAEARIGAVWSQDGDPRVTPLGRWLRKSHLDELPQLFNILKGEMALVGPRPERPEFVPILAEAIPEYLDRLAVLPGVSGLAQVNLPADTDLNSVRRKLILDREYIERAGVFLDLRILLATALRLTGCHGCLCRWLTGLHREASLQGGFKGQRVDLRQERPQGKFADVPDDNPLKEEDAAAVKTVRPGDTAILVRVADLRPKSRMRGNGTGEPSISIPKNHQGDRPRKPK